MKRLAVLTVGNIAIEERFAGAFVREAAGNNNDALAIGDRYSTGLNYRRPAKSPLARHQGPRTV